MQAGTTYVATGTAARVSATAAADASVVMPSPLFVRLKLENSTLNSHQNQGKDTRIGSPEGSSGQCSFTLMSAGKMRRVMAIVLVTASTLSSPSPGVSIPSPACEPQAIFQAQRAGRLWLSLRGGSGASSDLSAYLSLIHI